MAKRIVFSRKAFADIDRITDFYNRRNRSDIYSRKIVAGLNKRLKSLQKQPLTGINTDEPTTLLLIWDQFYVFYGITETAIEIKSIYHQKENIR